MSKNYIERNTYSELLELDLQEVVSENIKRFFTAACSMFQSS